MACFGRWDIGGCGCQCPFCCGLTPCPLPKGPLAITLSSTSVSDPMPIDFLGADPVTGRCRWGGCVSNSIFVSYFWDVQAQADGTVSWLVTTHNGSDCTGDILGTEGSPTPNNGSAWTLVAEACSPLSIQFDRAGGASSWLITDPNGGDSSCCPSSPALMQMAGPTRPAAYPPLLARARNLVGAIGRAAAAAARGEPVRAPADLVEHRGAICAGCPFLDRERARCTRCGCGGAKRHLLTEACPDGRW